MGLSHLGRPHQGNALAFFWVKIENKLLTNFKGSPLGWGDGLVVIKLCTPELLRNVQKPLKVLLLKPTLAHFNHITLIHKARSLTDWTVFVCHSSILTETPILTGSVPETLEQGFFILEKRFVNHKIISSSA